MATLTSLPSQAIIDGLKGTLDFYVNMGIPCVRAWPRSPGRVRTPAVQAGWAAWAWATSNWTSLSPEIQEAYRLTAKGTHLSGRDLFTKNFITNAYLELE